MKTTKKGIKNGLKCLVAGTAATLAIGATTVNASDSRNYVGEPAIGIESCDSKNKIYEFVKDTALFGIGGIVGLFSHELAHKGAADVFGMNASYDPTKDPFTTYYETAPKNNLEKAVTSGAGLFVQNVVSAGIVNSDIELRDSPFTLGYLAFTAASNLKYALAPNSNGDNSDVNQFSDATGVSQEVISGVLLASTFYLGKKVLDNFRGVNSSDSISKFSPHFAEDGDVGLKYNFGGKHDSSISMGVNAKNGSGKILFNIPLGNKGK